MGAGGVLCVCVCVFSIADAPRWLRSCRVQSVDDHARSRVPRCHNHSGVGLEHAFRVLRAMVVDVEMRTPAR
jgi:hypothetical protein